MAVAWAQTQLDTSFLGDGVTNPVVFTLLNTFTKGNTLVGAIFIEPTTNSVTSVTDNASNVYTLLDTATDVSGNPVTTFVSVNMQGVPTTLSVTFSATPRNGTDTEFIWCDEISGTRKTDGHTGQHAASGTSVSSGNITTTELDLLWGAYAPDSAPTVSAGSGFTLRINDPTNGLFSETEASVSPASVAATFTNSVAASGVVFVVAFAPFIFGPSDQSQFPVRGRQDYRMLAASSKVDEQWPFTAVKTPTQKGFDWDPTFPIRTWHRFRDADEQWPFTAVPTKGPIEWDWRPEFARRRFIPSRSADEEWPFTAVPTPAQFGWQLDPQFPTRRRFHPSRSADEQWPFTATLTPSQFGWQLDPQFPWRLRWRTFQSSDDEFPFTATVTPSQMGWPFEPSFPFRVKWQRVRRDEDVTAVPVAATPTWGLDDTILPSRLRFRPSRSVDEQWPFTSVVTPAQFGWDNPEHFPLRRRLPPLTLQDEEYPFTAVSTPTQFGWDNPEHFPLRVRFRPVLSADEQYPFTAAVTPTQFGWQIEPFFPSRLRFRPLVPAEQLLAPIAGTSTPTNIDFAYPPEFYTERRRYQPLVYEFWQPDIPPVSPTFQVMTGLAVKTKVRTGATYITVTLQGTGIFMFTQQPTPTIFNEVLPFGSAHIVLTSGTIPVSVALGVSNDGVNFVQLGPAIGQFPNIINLTASPTLNTPNLAPFKYHAWIVTGGDITTTLTIEEVFVGWRA